MEAGVETIGSIDGVMRCWLTPSIRAVSIEDQNENGCFDRLDLDAWSEHYKDCNGRPAKRRQQ